MKKFVRRVFVSQRRQSASIGAAVMGVLLLAGAALGTGIARTAVAVSDGLTWLGDDERGEVVQVNPASGRPETRLAVAGGDAQLDIIQRDGVLVVLDRRTGQITVIDLATLLASGRRQAPAGPTSKVLLAADRLFVVDRAGGSVAHVDPVTLADIGTPWAAGQPLADAVAAEDGLLWVVSADGVLHTLEWSDAERRFVSRSSRQVPGAGPRTVLVPHGKGVTLLGLEGGVVLQDGTGRDHSANTDPRDGDVLAAQTSPDDLVPAAVPGSGVVVILAGDRVLTVDAAAYGCPRPGRPAVFHDRVYVPCLGSGKVIVLDRDGERGGEDVHTGAGDPQLVFDDDKLFVQTPGGETGIVIDPDGDTSAVRVRDPELPVTDPERDPPPTPPSPPKPDPDEPTRTRPNQPPPTSRGNGNGNGGPTVTVPVTSSGPTTPTTTVSGAPAAPGQPAGITVAMTGRTDTQVTLRVSWNAPADTAGIAGYTLSANGASKQTGGTSDEVTFDCAAICATGGPVSIQVTAYTATATGTPAVTSWNLPARPAPTTTTAPPPRTTTTTPPPPPTTTQPPPPTTTTTTTPPPPAMPTAGAAVITGVSGLASSYQRTVTMAPPADWAGHDGTCEVVNTTYGWAEPIACSATSASIGVDIGANAIVVRAHARDGSRSVDSAARNAFMREPNPCENQRPPCQIPAVNEAPAQESAPTGVMVGAGIGLLLTSALLRIRRRGEHA